MPVGEGVRVSVDQGRLPVGPAAPPELANEPETAGLPELASGPGTAGLPELASGPATAAGSGPTGPVPEPSRRPGGIWQRAVAALGHEWTLACLAALAVAVVMTWPGARHPATTIPGDIGDPTFQAWQMAWAGHALVTNPAQLWNGNAFYPDAYSYAFSDTLFGYFPAGLIGTGPTAAIVRYNVMFVLLHALAFVGGYALLRQLGVGRAAAATAGAAFGYAPWRWAHAGHMNVLSVGGIALALAMLARGHGYSLRHGFRPDRIRPGWALAGWCAAAWQVSLGFGVGLPFTYVLLAICVVASIRWRVRGRPPLGRRLVRLDAAGALGFMAAAGFMAWPYLQVLRLQPGARRSVADLDYFSPDPLGFVTAPAQSLPWGALLQTARDSMAAPAETSLLPGFGLYALALAGLFFSAWSVRTRLWLLTGTGLSLVLAMGTHFFGGTFTYLLLYHCLPGFSSIRTPGRLVLWTTLLLAVLAAGAVQALSERLRRATVRGAAGPAVGGAPSRPVRWYAHPLLLVALLPALLVLAEGSNWGNLAHPVVPAQPAAMRTVDGPLLVLPSDQLIDMNVMLWSTTAFQRMANGGSGTYPRDQGALREAGSAFPDPTSVRVLRRYGVRTVLVLKAQAVSTPRYARAAAPDVPLDGLGVTRRDEGDTIIYTLDR